MLFSPVSYGNFPKFRASSDTQQPERPMLGVKGSPTLVLRGSRLGCTTSVMTSYYTTGSLVSDEGNDKFSNEEIDKFCLTNGVIDDSVIIQTCLMDDATLLGVSIKIDGSFLDLARKILHGQEMTGEQKLLAKRC